MVIQELAIVLGLEIDETAWAAGEELVKSMKGGLLAIGAAFGGVAVGLGEMLKKTAEAGENISLSSKKIGIATDALQGLRFAAEESGVGAEALDNSLKHLARSAYEAATVGGAAGAAFYKLGVQAFDPLTGKVRGADQILGDLADRFQRLPDGPQKAALAMQIFGREGASMIPLLDKGRAGIEEMRKEAEHFGVVMSESTIASSVAFEKSIRHANDSLIGLRNTLAGPLLRTVGPLVEKFAQWVAVNRQFIAQRIAEVIGFVTRAMGGLYEVLKLDWEILQNLRHVPGWLLAIGAAVAALAAPWAAVAAAIGLFLEDFYVFTQGGDSVIGRLLYALDRFVEHFRGLVKELGIFGALKEEAEEFSTWFAKTLVAKFIMAMLDAMGGGAPPRPKPGQAVINTQPPATSGQGFSNVIGNLFGVPQFPVPRLPPGMIPPMLAAPQLTANITVNAGPGADGQQISEAMMNVLRPWWEQTWSGVLADTAAATNR
jgi:hypothetical protein